MLMIQERQGKSQIGSTSNSSAGYVVGAGDINFATGQYILIRMKNWLPKGATIQTASLRFHVVAKNAGTAQICYNSIRAHASGDSGVLNPGVAEGARPWTTARIVWNLNWTPNPPDPSFFYVDVKPILDELMARSDYQPGGYVTFMLYTDNENGSDMGIRANNDFSNTPRLQVQYEDTPSDDVQRDINLMANPNVELLTGIDHDVTAPNAPAFSIQNPFFGAFVDPANQGLIERDTSFVRVPGSPTMRFTTGTPPETDGKSTGVTIKSLMLPRSFQYIFAGWIYIPSNVTTLVRAGNPYDSRTYTTITARAQWVPFCTSPIPLDPSANEVGTFWPSVWIASPLVAGRQFWISEPTIMHSSFKRMPFNGRTAPILDSGQSPHIVHKMSSPQTAVREWLPRRGVLRDGTLKRVPTYTKRSDGILQISEPMKGGPQIQNMGSGPIPPNKTYAEL